MPKLVGALGVVFCEERLHWRVKRIKMYLDAYCRATSRHERNLLECEIRPLLHLAEQPHRGLRTEPPRNDDRG